MSRPHLSASIVELERIFATTEDDRKVLKTLLAELDQRSTERAGRLKAKVIAALEDAETSKAPPRAPTIPTQPSKPPEPPRPTAPKALPPEPKPEAKLSLPPPWLDRGPRRAPPPVRDRPEDVLSAWTALEVLSPVTYRKPADMADGDARRIAALDGGLPWRPPGEKARQNKQLFYQVVLGAVRMDEATNALLSVFVDKHQDRPVARGMAAIATATVDKAGVPVVEGAATALSSFAWGLPLALKQDLIGLGRWPEAETKLNEDLDRRLRRVDDEGKPVPLDAVAIRGAYDWLVGTLGLHPTFVAEFQQTVGSVQVGFPLLVHRRCADLMFSLSNAIAYSNLMVHATPSRASPIRDVLGPSRWVDVVGGRTEDKWSEAEGAAAVALLRRLSDAGMTEPDLYIVSPFVIVAQRLRERVSASGLLQRWTSDPYAWTRDRIGTVHTVQGREADTVILVLGAPLPTQRGARGWAGGYPNLLNVAVTRAKENLYVVGAQDAWREVGVFRHLATRLPAGAETLEPI